MVALSRPRHYVLFGVALALLFGGVFQVTQAVHVAPDGQVEPLPVLLEHAVAGLIPVEEDPDLADLIITGMDTHECLSSDPDRPGGLLALIVENVGVGDARGFQLFARLDVHNVDSGVSFQFEHDLWIENLAPGETTAIEVGYGFPVQDALILGPVVVDQPVPGDYRLEATLDRPSVLTSLGDVGILEEEDEYNNSAKTQTTGEAEGVC